MGCQSRSADHIGKCGRARDPFAKGTELLSLKVQQAFTVKEGEELDTLDAMQKFDMEIIYNIAWALAKVGNTTIKDPIKFYSEFGDFKPIEHITDILDMALRSLSPSFSLEIEEEEEKN